MPFRKQTRSHSLARMACPSCGARIGIDPSLRRARIQCPRCMGLLTPPVESPPEIAATRPAGADGTGEIPPAAAPPAAVEVESAPPVSAAAAAARSPAPAAPAPPAPDAVALRLAEAEKALAESAVLFDRFRDLEKRIFEMGAQYLRAVERIRELETADGSESGRKRTRPA
jgi:hypothetical protein